MSTLGLPSDECLLEYDDHRLLASIAESAQTIAQGGGGVASLPWVSPKDFGAVGNGVADDTVPVQQAFDAINTGSKTMLVFDGMFAVSDTITYSSKKAINILGLGSNTGLLGTADFGDILLITAPYALPTNQDIDTPDTPLTESDGLLGIRLDNFGVYSSVVRTSGFAIHTAWTDGASILRVKCGSISDQHWTIYGGIAMEAQSNCDIAGCEIYSLKYGVYVNGFEVPGDMGSGMANIPIFHYDGQVRECVLWGGGIQDDPRAWVADSYGVWVNGGCGGFRVQGNTNISGYFHGYHVDTFAGSGSVSALQNNRELFISETFLDSNGTAGAYIGSAITLLTLTDFWCVANNQDPDVDPDQPHGIGLWVVAQVGAGINIFGGKIEQQVQDIYIDDSLTSLTCTGVKTQVVNLVNAQNVSFVGGILESSLTTGTVTSVLIKSVREQPDNKLTVGDNATTLTNIRVGQTTLSGGTAVVADASVTANTKIFVSVHTLGTIAIAAAYDATTRTPGTNFTIKSSSGTDTSVVDYLMLEP